MDKISQIVHITGLARWVQNRACVTRELKELRGFKNKQIKWKKKILAGLKEKPGAHKGLGNW